MPGRSVAEIGQLLVGDLGAAFGITAAPDKAMALFQGMPVDDQIVHNGQLNPLRMKLWLAQFDTTLILQPSQATITPPPGGSSASEWYGQIVNAATPVDATTATGEQLVAALVGDRESYKHIDPSQPFECEPPDWPAADAQGWQSWDSSQHDTSTTTTTGADAEVRRPFIANAQWMILTDVQAPTAPSPPIEIAASHAAIRFPTTFATRAFETEPLRTTVVSNEVAMLSPTRAASTIAIQDQEVAVPFTRQNWFDHINLVDGRATTVTTTSDDVTIGFDYMLVTLRRTINGTLWWDDALLSTPAWFLPGFAQGSLLAGGLGAAVHVLPYALIIARRATVSGTWDNQQNTTHVGPLHVTASNAGGGLSIGWDGMQAIGLLGQVLPALPPLGDPTLGTHA